VNTTEGTVGDVFWLRANAAVSGCMIPPEQS
jgi:hypothetical protein